MPYVCAFKLIRNVFVLIDFILYYLYFLSRLIRVVESWAAMMV